MTTIRTALHGRAGSPGVGVGRLLVVRTPAGRARTPSGGPGSPGTQPSGVDATATERERLAEALERAATDLGSLAQQTAARAGDEVGAIFEAQALFARDPGVVGPAQALIDAGSTAADAILRATDEQAAVLAAVDDPYFRERAADVRDVGRRVAAILRGETRPDLWHPEGVPAVIVAADLDPSAVATLRPELVAGIALAGGAPTGHAAIVARALGIPLVLGLGPAIEGLPSTATALVDGDAGELVIEPADEEIARRASPAASDPEDDGVRVATRDGASVDPDAADGEPGPSHGVTVVANVASALEAESAARSGADGIGLVRTELLFLGRTTPPSVAEQRATYAAIRTAMGERPVVFRTLDIGGDKPASWGSDAVEANPALGVRGIRLGLRRTDLLDDQLSALLQAAAGGELQVMLPMVATREEFDAARARLDAVTARLTGEGVSVPAIVRLGVMIEVPSAALMADALADAADFFSIGTNDLVQYTLAADRTNPDLADLATALQPAVLRLIDWVGRAAARRGRHVAVCGEAAADPRMIPLLVGLGVSGLSVSPGSIAAVRAVLAGLDIDACRALAGRALAAKTLAEIETLTAG
jgi:phosphoenolpyruvate-protein phosphotransferase